ncbi:MAG: ribonuclease PH [Prochlorotrichaceae cyanobacterium]
MPLPRPDGRQPNQLRPVQFQHQFTQATPGSVLAQFGQTQVLCTVTLQPGVPRFLEGTGRGWLTAEYRMLPGATRSRQPREFMKLSGRTQEIQRLIGRSLRACLDFEKLGENTLLVDADVLQADAGTRTAAITGGYVALQDAIVSLVAAGKLTQNPLNQAVAAVSVGIVDDIPLLDLNYDEDVQAQVDCNIVMTEHLELIEIQGTGEEGSFSRQELNQILDLAEQGIQSLLIAQKS